MHELAKITGIRSDISGTEMKVFVPEKNLFNTILDKRIHDVELRLDDGRTITNAQRKKAYATIRDIADYTGYLPEQMKEIMKYEYIIRTGNDYFSLGTCTVDTAREFISMLLEFCLEQGIHYLIWRSTEQMILEGICIIASRIVYVRSVDAKEKSITLTRSAWEMIAGP